MTPDLLMLDPLRLRGDALHGGMWSNAIRLINVVTAALLATNFFEPAGPLAGRHGRRRYTYLWDFLALWGLFALFMLILRTVTDQVSRVKVRFLNVADQIGSTVFALWIGWVLVCFTMMTLHTAPLGPQFPLRRLPARTADGPGLGAGPAVAGIHAEGCRWARSAGRPRREEWREAEVRVRPARRVHAQVRHPPGKLEANVAKHDSICASPSAILTA